MKAKNNDWVSVVYEGSFTDGKVFDKNDEKQPLTFKLGAKQVVPGFEKAVDGLEVGKEIKVTIKPKDAYGEKNTNILEIPKETFGTIDLSKLKLNTELEVMSEMGPLMLEIKKIEDKIVKAIVNHPLAGKDLVFKIKLLKILDEKETKHMEKHLQEHTHHKV